jgi:phosphoglycerate dehydrogenase-like enzyme
MVHHRSFRSEGEGSDLSDDYRVLLAGSPYFERRYDRIAEALTEDGVLVRRCHGQHELPAGANWADVLLADRHLHITKEIIESAPRLRALISPIAGVDQFDLRAANEKNLIVGRGQTPENSVGMAEATILLMLACCYDLHGHEAILRSGAPRPTWPMSRLLRGKTLGLIGYGKISRLICERFSGWGVRILVTSRYTIDHVAPHVERADLEDLLANSDIVSLHSRLDKDTRGMMNADRFAQMKKGVIFINTSRAALVDLAALAAAVRNGIVAKVAIDAIDPLPLAVDSPLRQIADAILTPHMLGHTQEGAENLVVTAIESIRRVLAGDPPVYFHNPEVLDAWRAKWSAR